MFHAQESKQTKALRTENAVKQQQMDANDLKRLAETLMALSNFDAVKARGLIMSPHTIKNLMTGANNIRCPYLLHAILLALTGEDRNKILNEMRDEDIAVLKECIDIAQKCKIIIEPEIISSQITIRKNKRSSLPTRAQLDNELVLTSLLISQKVMKLYGDATLALDNWNTDVQNFKRTTQLDVTALEIKLAALAGLYKKAEQELILVEAERKTIQKAIATATDDDKIGELSVKLTTINNNVKQKKSVVEQYKKVKELHENLRNAQKALNTAISAANAFIASTKQKSN